MDINSKKSQERVENIVRDSNKTVVNMNFPIVFIITSLNNSKLFHLIIGLFAKLFGRVLFRYQPSCTNLSPQPTPWSYHPSK